VIVAFIVRMELFPALPFKKIKVAATAVAVNFYSTFVFLPIEDFFTDLLEQSKLILINILSVTCTLMKIRSANSKKVQMFSSREEMLKGW
jgi:hypothetical protein